jgi:hypothetical protein
LGDDVSLIHDLKLIGNLELVQVLDLRRRRANFISGEAKFAAICGQYGENFNEA